MLKTSRVTNGFSDIGLRPRRGVTDRWHPDTETKGPGPPGTVTNRHLTHILDSVLMVLQDATVPRGPTSDGRTCGRSRCSQWEVLRTGENFSGVLNEDSRLDGGALGPVGRTVHVRRGQVGHHKGVVGLAEEGVREDWETDRAIVQWTLRNVSFLYLVVPSLDFSSSSLSVSTE